jgi:hypothetical protein
VGWNLTIYQAAAAVYASEWNGPNFPGTLIGCVRFRRDWPARRIHNCRGGASKIKL